MANFKLNKSKLFRSLVICSILATLLLLYNIISISFTRRQEGNVELEFPTEGQFLGDFHSLPNSQEVLPPINKNELPGFIQDKEEPDETALVAEQEEESNPQFVFPLDGPALVIVTHHDPDPGEELQADPDNKELFNEQPEPDDYIPPADSQDPDLIKLLKESSLSFQREAIVQKFASLENEDQEIRLSSLQLSEGGKPIRNMIFSTWKSGSAFIGEAMASYPLTFYHHEPLIYKGITQIGPLSLDEARDAANTLQSLLTCEYSQVGELVNYFKENQDVHNKNSRLWKFCQKTNQLCMDPSFLSEMCGLFPYQAMNVVRLRLKLAESFLSDEELNVRVLHLVRDPRGIISFRSDQPWCTESSACHDPVKLCSDMVDDFYSALELREKYPDTFLVLRYEDILIQLQHGFEVLLHHFRLQFQPEIQKFLETRTLNSHHEPTTFDDSSTQPFKWKEYFQIKKDGLEDLRRIEESCSEAMDLWGYATMSTGDALGNNKFNPVLEPPWPEMRLI